jgi:hypothetical protein
MAHPPIRAPIRARIPHLSPESEDEDKQALLARYKLGHQSAYNGGTGRSKVGHHYLVSQRRYTP